MDRSGKSGIGVRVCTGAGCKAWKSEAVCRRLQAMAANNGAGKVQMRRVGCMRQCGGGVSVRAGVRAPVLKLRHPDDAPAVLRVAGKGLAA